MTKSSEAASDRQQNGPPEDMKNIQLVEDKFEDFFFLQTFDFLLIHVGFENLLLSPVPSYPGEDLFLSRLNFTFSFLL